MLSDFGRRQNKNEEERTSFGELDQADGVGRERDGGSDESARNRVV